MKLLLSKSKKWYIRSSEPTCFSFRVALSIGLDLVFVWASWQKVLVQRNWYLKREEYGIGNNVETVDSVAAQAS
jgi:hypothetical protein